MSKLFWLSWEQEGSDSRPIAWPPPEGVLGFWASGYSDDSTSVVGLVRAESGEAAEAVIEKAWNPGVREWRFNHDHDAHKPPGDRFPPPKWSIEMGRWPWELS